MLSPHATGKSHPPCGRPDWTGPEYECEFDEPGEGIVTVSRVGDELRRVSIILLDRRPTIIKSRVFADLKKLASAQVSEGGHEVAMPVGASTWLDAGRDSYITLTKITPLDELAAVLDDARAMGDASWTPRPTRLHLERDDFQVVGLRESRGGQVREAAFTCIPVWGSCEDRAVIGALARTWGKPRAAER